MTEAVTSALNSNLAPANLWGAVAEVLPIVLPLVLFGFGFYLVRRVINSARKGKPKM